MNFWLFLHVWLNFSQKVAIPQVKQPYAKFSRRQGCSFLAVSSTVAVCFNTSCFPNRSEAAVKKIFWWCYKRLMSRLKTYHPAEVLRRNARTGAERLGGRPSLSLPPCLGAVCHVSTGRGCCLFPLLRWNRPATFLTSPEG